jgi:colanic acid biosynthesis glycosyl transferase WcaI
LVLWTAWLGGESSSMNPSPAPRKRIVIITQFYPPEATAASNRVCAMARGLAAAGADVTVVTGRPSFPDGVIPPQYRGRSGAAETDGSIRVHRVWTYASARLRTVDRIANWLSVSLGVTLFVLRRREPVDVVLVSTPPVTLALPALVAGLRHRAPVVLDVRDVYPEVAIKLGIWKPRSLPARLVTALSETLYRRARLIFTVTETCRQEILAHGVPAAKVVNAPNGFDKVRVALHGLAPRTNGEFVVAYAGNMGVATGMDAVLDAARELLPKESYRFVLVGGGAESAGLARRIEREQLSNVTLLGAQPRDIAAAVLRDADVCLVPLRRGIVDSLPSKLFDALSLGTPVIVCADGEAKSFIERSGGGIAVPPENGSALASAIGELAADPVQCEELGRNGMSYVRANYDRANVVSDVVRRIGSLSPS